MLDQIGSDHKTDIWHMHSIQITHLFRGAFLHYVPLKANSKPQMRL